MMTRNDCPFGGRRAVFGFSLIEVTIVLAILSGVSAVLYSAFAAQTATQVRETGNAIAQNDARSALERMIRDIQSAGFDPQAKNSFGFLTIDPDQVQFTTDANRDGQLQTPDEDRGFDLSNGSLRAWLGGSSWRTLVTRVETLSFAYLDAVGQPTNVKSAIRQVTISIGIRSAGWSPGMNPALRTLTGTAYVRND